MYNTFNMISRRLITLSALSALLLFIPVFTVSQPVIIVTGNRFHLQRIDFEEHRKANPHGKQIMRDFATALATNPDNLNTVFQCEINREASLINPYELNVRFRVVNGEVRRDTHLRGFDLSKVLLPAAFQATFLITTSGRDTLLNETQRAIRLTQGNSAHIRYKVEIPAATDTVWFEVKDLYFFHERQSVSNLTAMIQHTANYYAADRLLKKTQEEMGRVNCKNPDLLPECFFVLLKAQRVLNHIANANFSGNLSLGVADPVQLQKRLEIGMNTHSFLMREFSSLMQRTNRIYLTKREDDLIMDYVDGITSFVEDDTHIGFAAAPFVNELLHIEYAGKQFEQDANYFRRIAALINPGVSPQEASARLLSLIYHAMLLRAGDFMADVNYNKAIILLENAERFCKAFHEVDCRADVSYELSKARHGLYGFYLSVAGKAIEMQRPDIASSYVFMARNYQRQNSKQIIHDGEVMLMLIRLFDAYVLEAAKHNKAGNFDSAYWIINRVMEPDFYITPTTAWHEQRHLALNGLLMRRLQSLRSSLETQPVTLSETIFYELMQFVDETLGDAGLSRENEQLMRSLLRTFVRQLVSAAEKDMANEFFEEAIRKLMLARKINGESAFEPIPAIDSLSYISGREVLFDMLRRTVILINQGRTDDAFLLFNEAILRRRTYRLDNDPIILSRFDEIFNAYLKIKCVQMQSRLDQTLIYAQRQAKLKSFVQAVDTLQNSLAGIAAKQICDFSTAQAESFLQQHRPAAEFQQALLLAERAFQMANMQLCLRHIESAEQLYSQHNLEKFGLAHFSMVVFAQDKNNSSLNIITANRYVQLGRFNEAFVMLELLREAGISAAELVDIQAGLGFMMGEKDRGQISFFQSFAKARQYSGGGAWYKSFHKSYRRGLGYRFP